MANIGERVSLEILRDTPVGLFLDAGGDIGDILLPGPEMPNRWEIGGEVDVFLYTDSEDRPVATMKMPKVMPGEFAFLEIISRTGVGAFLDWGLPKDLLLPFSEQRDEIEVGRSVIVYVRVDEKSGRIVATQRVRRFLDDFEPDYFAGEEVDLLIYGKTELGYKAIINNLHSGVLFHNEVFRRLRHGERTKGYVQQIREDGKIDLSLQPIGRAGSESLEIRLEKELQKRGGFLPLDDSSPAEQIHDELGVSKKQFKKAAGALFKKRLITFERGGMKWLG